MSAGHGPGRQKAFFYALQLRGVGGVTPLEVLLHFVIRRSKCVQLVSLCLPSRRLCCQVAVERHICNQSWVVSILNRLVECEVEGCILEEDTDLLIKDVGVLREVGTMAGGADNPPSKDLAIR